MQVVKDSVKVNLTQKQFDALASLAFNIGKGGFEKSSVLQLVNDPNAKTPYADLEAAWKALTVSQGKENKGLENRRQAELRVYNSGNYAR